MYGFANMDADALRRVIAKYEAGLASHSGYPCGRSRSTVRRWLNKARAELETR